VEQNPILTIENDRLCVKIKSQGAELCSVVSKPQGMEYIWQASQDLWPRHAPVLFPIVGRLKNNAYSYQGQSYALGQHGFARDTRFICVEQSSHQLVFELTASDTTLTVFPFHFSLQIRYTLVDDQLDIAYHVFNPDNKPLYFSIGAHPGFNCPLAPGEAFSDYRLEFPGRDELSCQQLSDGLLSGKVYPLVLKNHILPVSKALFANDALVLTGSQVSEVKLISGKSGHGVSVQCGDWPCFGIWTKKNTESFICLEPWYGVADNITASGELTEKPELICLAPLQEFSSRYSIAFF
jgi:galactose mutarotase-like enzyme